MRLDRLAHRPGRGSGSVTLLVLLLLALWRRLIVDVRLLLNDRVLLGLSIDARFRGLGRGNYGRGNRGKCLALFLRRLGRNGDAVLRVGRATIEVF